MAELTPEERSTPIGFFNFADSYWAAASGLHDLKLKSTHRDSPTTFLYHQAIELYLKSFLRLKDVKVADLFGHKIVPLSKRTKKFGLSFDDEDLEVFGLLDSSNSVITARYLQTGFSTCASIEALERTCKSIREAISVHMKQAGLPVRAVRHSKKIST
jgi:HEPN domain-containing protein